MAVIVVGFVHSWGFGELENSLREWWEGGGTNSKRVTVFIVGGSGEGCGFTGLDY